MMSLRSMTAAAALGLAAAPAFAGGLAPVAVEPAPVYVEPEPVMTGGDWNGASAGLSLGYGSIDDGAMIYGLRGGWDYDFGGFVVGATGSYDWTDMDFGGDTLNSIGRLGVRGGADIGDTLLYATGGAAWANASVGGTTATDMGWYGGIGVEHKLAGNWTVGGEILTNRFSDFNGSGTDFDATTFGVNVGMRF